MNDVVHRSSYHYAWLDCLFAFGSRFATYSYNSCTCHTIVLVNQKRISASHHFDTGSINSALLIAYATLDRNIMPV